MSLGMAVKAVLEEPSSQENDDVGIDLAVEHQIEKAKTLARRKRNNHPHKGNGSNGYEDRSYKLGQRGRRIGGPFNKWYSYKHERGAPLTEPQDVSVIAEQAFSHLRPTTDEDIPLCWLYNELNQQPNGGSLAHRVEFGAYVPESIKRYEPADLVMFALSCRIAHFESHNGVGYLDMDKCRIEYGANVPDFIKGTKQDNSTTVNLMQIAGRNQFAHIIFEDGVAYFSVDKYSEVVIGDGSTGKYILDNHGDYLRDDSDGISQEEKLFNLGIMDPDINVSKKGSTARLYVNDGAKGLTDTVQGNHIDLTIILKNDIPLSKEGVFFYTNKIAASR